MTPMRQHACGRTDGWTDGRLNEAEAMAEAMRRPGRKEEGRKEEERVAVKNDFTPREIKRGRENQAGRRTRAGRGCG